MSVESSHGDRARSLLVDMCVQCSRLGVAADSTSPNDLSRVIYALTGGVISRGAAKELVTLAAQQGTTPFRYYAGMATAEPAALPPIVKN